MLSLEFLPCKAKYNLIQRYKSVTDFVKFAKQTSWSDMELKYNHQFFQKLIIV
jgi:hypothetical protein